MTDVIDDNMSWEQRRELRRKKRQELLAETERISHDRSAADDDEFERERQRRRKEREERRRKEREELERQLKEEEDSRAERERKREERRRQREEELDKQYGAPPTETYTSTTVITKSVECHEEHNGDEDTTVVTESTEVVEEEYMENGHHEEQQDDVDGDEALGVDDQEEEEEKEEMEEEEEEQQRNGVDDEDAEQESKSVYRSTVTTVTVTSKISDHRASPADDDDDDDTDEVRKKLNEMKLKRQVSDKKRYETYDDDDEEARKEKLRQIEERRKAREQKRVEEEEREKEEAAKREAEHQERLRVEREERERRRAEAEEKRKEMRKKLSQSDEHDHASPLSQKMTSPLVSKSLDSAVDAASSSDDASVENEVPECDRQGQAESEAPGSDEKKMSGPVPPKPPAVPRRTQSTRIKLSDYKTSRGLRATESFNESDTSFHPTRPLSRKNRTRRSLDAMEKQADDLYDFLSELETKRVSCSKEELLGFLQDGSDAAKPKSDAGPAAIKKRPSVRDRAKAFQDIKEEHGEHATETVRVRTSRKTVDKPNEKSDFVQSSTVISTKSDDGVKSSVRANLTSATTITSDRGAAKGGRTLVVAQAQTVSVRIEKEKAQVHIPVVLADSRGPSPEGHRRPEIAPSKEIDGQVGGGDSDVGETQSNTLTSADSRQAEVNERPVDRKKPNLPHKPERLAAKAASQGKPPSQDKTSSATERRAESRRERIAKYKSAPDKRSEDKLPLKCSADGPESSDSAEAAPPHRGAAAAKNQSADARSRASASPPVAGSHREDKDVPNERVEQLNKHITETPKTTKARDTTVASVSSLDSRKEKYTKQASKQEVKKTPSSVGKSAGDVSDRRNRWERGEVVSAEKSSVRKEHVVGAGGISSRKNMWETGQVAGASTPSKPVKDVPDIKGGDFSSRKNQWLKVTQQGSAAKKTETPVTMKTGVMSRLNQWEKGNVSGSSHDKPKAKGDLPVASGVGNRRAKFENIGDSPKPQPAKTTVHLASDVSNRRNKWESKAADQQAKSAPSKREAPADDRSSTPDGSYDDDAASSHSGSQGRDRYQDDDTYSDEN